MTAARSQAASAGQREARLGGHQLSWHCQHPTRPGLVSGYAAHPPAELADGIAAIAAALRRVR